MRRCESNPFTAAKIDGPERLTNTADDQARADWLAARKDLDREEDYLDEYDFRP